jgi:catechol 2,3-dioxygenase-like lactoylglutathione lyase family enzyme
MIQVFAMMLVVLAGAAPASAADLNTIYPRSLIVVSDIDKSLRFYSYALGWKVTRNAPIADTITFKHLGIPDTHTARIAVVEPAKELYGKPRDGAVLALLQIDNPKPPAVTRPANLAVGQHVLAVRTDDIKTVIARLKEIGATFAVEPVETPDGLIEMAVLDPDGVRLQINQRPDR